MKIVKTIMLIVVVAVLLFGAVRGIGAAVTSKGPSGGCNHIALISGHPGKHCTS